MSNKYPIGRIVKQNNKKYIFLYKWKNNEIITDKKIIERINKLRIPPAYQSVKIYSPTSKYQYTAKDLKGRSQVGYHELWIKERYRKKFRHLIEFVEVYPKIQKKINSLLTPNDPQSKEQLIALAINLLDKCKIRPGSNKHLRDTGSYGTTTLCKKHLKKENGHLFVSFSGKSGVINECKIKNNTKLAKILYNMTKNKNSNSPIFSYNNMKITPNDINIFLQKIGGVNISSKSFRTYHANVLFLETILPFIEQDETEKQRKKRVIEIIKFVSSKLHHNPATDKKSYLFTPIINLYIENPNSFKKLFLHKNIDKSLVSFIKKNTISKKNIPKNWY